MSMVSKVIMTWLSVFLASLIGSTHCVGMCGPITLAYSTNSPCAWKSHLQYHIGRMITYTGLGFVSGWLGSQINELGSQLGYLKVAPAIMGALLIWLGLRIFIQPGIERNTPAIPRRLKALLGKIFQLPYGMAVFFVGLFTGFLPCGWLYSFIAVAIATADPIKSALTMFLFWLGSVPALLAVGGVFRVLIGKFGWKQNAVLGSLMIIAGVFSLLWHFSSNGLHHHHH